MTTPDIAEARRLADEWEPKRPGISGVLRAMADDLERLRARVAPLSEHCRVNGCAHQAAQCPVWKDGERPPYADAHRAAPTQQANMPAGVPALAELRQRFVGIPDASGKGATEPAPSLTVESAELRDAQEGPFEDWWNREGQYLRAGGDSYSKTFAWHAWIRATARAAQPSHQPAQGMNEELDAVVKFLMGAGPLDGAWFGDHPSGKPSFWWRDKLRAALAQAPAAVPQWQPIETAPTGHRALLWAPGWSAPAVDDWGKYCAYNHPKFTHWMPLPALPDALAAAKEQP